MSRHGGRDSFGGGGGGRKAIECFTCGMPGHHSRDCPQKNAAGGGGGGQPHRAYPKVVPHAGVMGLPPMMQPELQINLGHTPLDAQKRIKQLLIMMTPDEQSITRMSLSLLEDIRAHNLLEFVCTTILHCVKCLPQKSLVFVGLLAAIRLQYARGTGGVEEADKFLHTFIGLLLQELSLACKESRWTEMRVLLRCSVGLAVSGMVDWKGVWEGLRKVKAMVEQPDLLQSQREYLLYTLLSLVPFMSDSDPAAFTAWRKELDELVHRARGSKVEMLNVTVQPVSSPGAASSSSSSSAYLTAPFSFDLLDCWVHSLSTLGTKEEFAADPSEVSVQRSSYAGFKPSVEKVKPLPLHLSDALTLPPSGAPRLRRVLRLFPRRYDGFPLNELLVGEYVGDLLGAFEALHKEGTKQLLSLPLPLSEEARQVGQYLLIESIFAELLTLPTPPVRPIYYGAILIDLFKAQPNLMPPLLGSGVNFLFHRLGDLDVECTERLLDWFTFHLSNFGYAWPWISWAYVLEQSDAHPQRRFVQQALALCVRLSYWERIQQVIPEEFVLLMPHQPLPAFRFSTKNIQSAGADLNIQQYYQFSLELMSIIQGKSHANAVVQWLDQTVTPVLGNEARVRLFTPCLLECGNKSYSHTISLLERYKVVFQTLCETTLKRRAPGEAADKPEVPMPAFDVQRLILHSLSEYWQHSIQHIIVLLEQFYVFGCISIQAVIGWSFFASRHPIGTPHIWRPLLYPLLGRALAKLQSELQDIRDKPPSMSLTQEKRDADETAIKGLELEAREILSMVVSNFQKLAIEAHAQVKKLGGAGAKERERERAEQDLQLVRGRFKQFVRYFAKDLAPHVTHLQEFVLQKQSPLADVVAQIPLIL